MTHPVLAAQFQPTKNGDLTPADVIAGTAKKLWWKCPNGPDHEWRATGNSRIGGSGCPVCVGRQISASNNLAVTHPGLAAQFHPTKNGDLTPADVIAGTAKKLWWKCPNGPGHEWQVTGNSRVGGTGCPACAGLQVSVTNNLNNYPELAAQFHPTKNRNLTPTDVVAGTHRRLWWKCPEGPDHEWEATGHNRLIYSGCPFCVGQRPSVTNNLNNYPELAAQLHPMKNGGLTPADVVAGTGKRLWWKCPEVPDHEWRAAGSHRLRGSGCPTCAKSGFKPSKPAWLYLLEHPTWDLLQIGITNVPSERLVKHQGRGWVDLDLYGPINGDLARNWESAILLMLRASSALVAPTEIAGRFDGYTESWVRASCPATTIRELKNAVEANEALDSPDLDLADVPIARSVRLGGPDAEA